MIDDRHMLFFVRPNENAVSVALCIPQLCIVITSSAMSVSLRSLQYLALPLSDNHATGSKLTRTYVENAGNSPSLK